MARPKLAHKGQPFWLYAILRFYEFLASLKLAVILILSLAVVLALATFIESNFGSAGVQWYVYHSWWFIVLQILLAVNIFCAASIRYPWKRHQTGFVITHIGLLVLMAGSAISFRDNLNSQMLVYQGSTSNVAVDTDENFIKLYNIPGRPEPVQFHFESGPFNWGVQPFKQLLAQQLDRWDWSYNLGKSLGLNKIGGRFEHASELVYQDDTLKVEIVDFYSRTRGVGLPHVALTFVNPLIGQDAEIELDYTTYEGPSSTVGYARKNFFGDRGEILVWRADSQAEVKGFLNAIPDQTIREGTDGAVVLWTGGEFANQLAIGDLQKLAKENKPFDLGDGRSVKLLDYSEGKTVLFSPESMKQYPWLVPKQERINTPMFLGPWVKLEVKTAEDAKPQVIEITANNPFMVQNVADDFRAEFYHPMLKGRVDILEGPDNKLYYRVWQQKQGRIISQGELKLEYDRENDYYRSHDLVNTWSMGGAMAGGKTAAWQMYVSKYVPENKLSQEYSRVEERLFMRPSQVLSTTVSQQLFPLPLPFDKDDAAQGATKQAKLRVSQREDASSEWNELSTFWLPLNLPATWAFENSSKVQNVEVAGQEQPMQIEFTAKITDVGFVVKLVDFHLDVDPGSAVAAAYESEVIQIDVREKPEVKGLLDKMQSTENPEERQKVRMEFETVRDRMLMDYIRKLDGLSVKEAYQLADEDNALTYHRIYMNNPLDYPDLQGRTLRFFQENYLAPVDSGDEDQQRPLGSVYRVNYDPGRPIKYFGSLLICVGIFVMFYMRAYFFKTPKKRVVTEKVENPVPARK